MTASQLVILAGGRGTRLGDKTLVAPKPLMPITDSQVFLDYIVEEGARQGFERILILAGYLGSMIHDRYDGRTINRAHVTVSIEAEPMGTGGALRAAYDLLDELFVVVNGDTLFDVNLRHLEAELARHPSLMSAMALREVPDVRRFGHVLRGQGGHVTHFIEKDEALAGPGLINGGIYALRRSALDLLPTAQSSLERDLFPQLVERRALLGVEFDGYFIDIGVPETLQQAKIDLPNRKRPVLFLDRDGIINEYKPYLYRVEDFAWVTGVKNVIKRRNDLGHAVIVVTNQSGVGRGYYSEEDVEELHLHIQRALNREGAFIDGFYMCPFHKDAVHERYRVDNHPDRKPNPGMILKAAEEHHLDLSQAVLIGDSASDVEAAKAAGIAGYLFQGDDLYEFESAHILNMRGNNQ